MGGTGIAFLSGRSINSMNPASYSGIDSLMSIFELGVFGKYTIYSTRNDDQSLLNANLKYLAMGFRINTMAGNKLRIFSIQFGRIHHKYDSSCRRYHPDVSENLLG